jgi:hypothetical protein
MSYSVRARDAFVANLRRASPQARSRPATIGRMGHMVYRRLEHTPDARRAARPTPAANDAAVGRLADLGRAESDLHTIKGFVVSVMVGAALWAAVGALAWLTLR